MEVDQAKRSIIMSSIKAKNTKPELAVRRIAFALGYRYRLHRNDLPGKPDIVFPRLRKIILVHGCFWHQHRCQGGRLPSSNIEYWIPKLKKNLERDKNTIKMLKRLGWKCLVIWECQLEKPAQVRSRIQRFLAT
ncbi:DNA mismatch endonuclease Vsr [Oxalobacteraceae bacterium CAVE-383]|nr:DNA mismatch endonuclease Vsr [Oxalobacteraceae bacterium CAVE-383]